MGFKEIKIAPSRSKDSTVNKVSVDANRALLEVYAELKRLGSLITSQSEEVATLSTTSLTFVTTTTVTSSEEDAKRYALVMS